MPPLTFWSLALSFFAGLGIGSFYFGGLWWTTQKLSRSQSPALWLLGSFALRTTLALAGFYLVMQGRPERLILCMIGFWLARLASIRLTQPVAKPPSLDKVSVDKTTIDKTSEASA